MLNWENLEVIRPLLWKKELVEGKQHIMYHLYDLYKLLHSSEPLFLYLKKREIKFYLPGGVLWGSSEVCVQVSGTVPWILLSFQMCQFNAFLCFSSSFSLMGGRLWFTGQIHIEVSSQSSHPSFNIRTSLTPLMWPPEPHTEALNRLQPLLAQKGHPWLSLLLQLERFLCPQWTKDNIWAWPLLLPESSHDTWKWWETHLVPLQWQLMLSSGQMRSMSKATHTVSHTHTHTQTHQVSIGVGWSSWYSLGVWETQV